MKQVQGNNNNQNKKGTSKAQRPEIRDNLDSRKNEEQEFKGEDVTHNERDTKEDKLKKKK